MSRLAPFLLESCARIAPRFRPLGLALAILAASCGGEDKGRVSGSTPVVPALAQCAKANSGFTFQSIVDFEPSRSRDACNAAVSCDTPPFYFNQDQTHSVTTLGMLPPGTVSCATLDTVSRPKPGWLITDLSDDNGLPTGDGTIDIPEGPRCKDTPLGSTGALHITAANLSTCYGGNGRLGWGGSLDLKFAPAFDATGWDGISFWVRRGSGQSKPSFIFSVIDQLTDAAPDNTSLEPCNCWHNPDEPAGTIECPKDPSTNPKFPDSLKCDPFGAGITLNDDWTFATVYFSDLHQKGFGKPSPLGHVASEKVCKVAPEDEGAGGAGGANGGAAGEAGSGGSGTSTKVECKGGLTRIQFLMTSGDWDFWIDDVALFRAPR